MIIEALMQHSRWLFCWFAFRMNYFLGHIQVENCENQPRDVRSSPAWVYNSNYSVAGRNWRSRLSRACHSEVTASTCHSASKNQCCNGNRNGWERVYSPGAGELDRQQYADDITTVAKILHWIHLATYLLFPRQETIHGTWEWLYIPSLTCMKMHDVPRRW